MKKMIGLAENKMKKISLFAWTVTIVFVTTSVVLA